MRSAALAFSTLMVRSAVFGASRTMRLHCCFIPSDTARPLPILRDAAKTLLLRMRAGRDPD